MMKKIKKAKKGIKLWQLAKKIIPGGSQLLSKRSEMFLPGQWPSYYSKAKGVNVWDIDGNKYIDMSSMGMGTCILGYSDSDVNMAVKRAIDNGSMSTLNCPEEEELARLLCKLHPWAKMARFARSGGEAMAIAVRIARAHTGKDKVAFCGYHGWSDWYLAANLSDNTNLDGHLLPGLEPKGVPRGLLGTALPFNYNKIEELNKIVSDNKDIAAIVVETLRYEQPEDNFLKKVRAIADKIGAVLIFDEITIGWRMNFGGAHLLYNLNPDIAVFAKALSNGFPMAAIIGKKDVMKAVEETFISSTYWTERIGPVAALATIKKIIKYNVPKHLEKMGKMIEQGLLAISKKHEIKIKILLPYSLIAFSFDYGNDSQLIRTIFIQEMLRRGFLANTSIYLSYGHKESHIKIYVKACDQVFKVIKQAIDEKKLKNLLGGPIAQTGFKRLVN